MARRSDSRTLFDLPAGPDFACERRTTAALGRSAPIAGVDEAGRGPWAGPVVAAAVVLDPARLPEGLDDSKKLSAAARERLFEAITAGHHFAVAVAPVALIDTLNIRGATLWAMAEAVRALAPAHILVDGLDVPPDAGCPGTALVGGDGRSLSIAAASIVAKVTRDRLMLQLDAEFPGYGFAAHKGYGTAVHAAALDALGPCPQHRRSFEPVRTRLAGLAAPAAASLPFGARSGP